MHECSSHKEWLQSVHYMCSCGHVEWAHYGERLNKGRCAHCNCTQYNGETRPLTDYEKMKDEARTTNRSFDYDIYKITSKSFKTD